MTAVGSRKVNATGRSTGKRKTKHGYKIAGQFAPHRIEMLVSPAWRGLSLSARRLLDRLEIELANHGGADNGKLPTTYDDFERYGVHRHAIAPAMRELIALGFIEVTEKGRAGNAEWRKPNVFRLTYLPTDYDGPSDEWKKIETDKQAAAFARNARIASARKIQTQCRKAPHIGVENRHHKRTIHSPGTATTVHSADTDTTVYISEAKKASSKRARSAAKAERSARDPEVLSSDTEQNSRSADKAGSCSYPYSEYL
jgi:hypothetical protein